MLFNNKASYLLEGRSMNALWGIYMRLITDDGTPRHAIKGDDRRDLAQLMRAHLETAESVPDDAWSDSWPL